MMTRIDAAAIAARGTSVRVEMKMPIAATAQSIPATYNATSSTLTKASANGIDVPESNVTDPPGKSIRPIATPKAATVNVQARLYATALAYFTTSSLVR